jgi:hypothetical protein
VCVSTQAHPNLAHGVPLLLDIVSDVSGSPKWGFLLASLDFLECDAAGALHTGP